MRTLSMHGTIDRYCADVTRASSANVVCVVPYVPSVASSVVRPRRVCACDVCALRVTRTVCVRMRTTVNALTTTHWTA
jgi:hypothetical protein